MRIKNEIFRSLFSIKIFDSSNFKREESYNSNFPLNKYLNAQHHTLSSEFFSEKKLIYSFFLNTLIVRDIMLFAARFYIGKGEKLWKLDCLIRYLKNKIYFKKKKKFKVCTKIFAIGVNVIHCTEL